MPLLLGLMVTTPDIVQSVPDTEDKNFVRMRILREVPDLVTLAKYTTA